MSELPDQAGVVGAWIVRAEEDLDVAVNELARGVAAPIGPVCFHAQQAVEKYLKAVLVHLNVPFPKVHDLTLIHALLPKQVPMPLDGKDLSRASRFAVESRYPEHVEPSSRSDAEWAVEFARRVRGLVRPALPASAFAPPK